MFDKIKFAQIIKKISDTYDNQREFSEKSGINRTYLSQYMNMKLEEAPKPKTLEKLANSSNNITSYNELMEICGYTDKNSSYKLLLEDIYSNTENEYLERLTNFKLDLHEKEVYNDMFFVLPESIYNISDVDQIRKIIVPYIADIDFLTEESKTKVIDKLVLFVKYNNEANKIKNKILSINNIDSSLNKLSSEYYMCPVYGQISAGMPNWAEECIESRIPIAPNLMDIINPEECFFLRVNGESMNKVIKNGAYALIRKTDWVENGEIAVVLVNGFDATLKKFSKQGDLVILEPMSDDESFQVQIYDKNTPIKILGKYIGKFEIK